MASLVRGSTAVLSACNSGRGTIMSKGDVGVSRSFLAAGAWAVVSSLWSMRDESTRIFMSHF
jgi:CHAT domain-containing protein